MKQEHNLTGPITRRSDAILKLIGVARAQGETRMRITHLIKVSVAAVAAFALFGVGASTAQAEPTVESISTQDVAPDFTPQLSSVMPSSVQRGVATSFVISGSNLADVNQVFIGDMSYSFDRVSDSEIRVNTALAEVGDLTLRAASPSGSSNILTVTVTPTVWQVPANDLSITYGQEAHLSGEFSNLAWQDSIFFVVDGTSYAPDAIEETTAFLTLPAQELDAGEYLVVIGGYAPNRSLQVAADEPAGALHVLKASTTITYEVTGDTITGRVNAEFDSIPGGFVTLSREPGFDPISIAVDEAGYFAFEGSVSGNRGFEISYLGDVNHSPSDATSPSDDPLTPGAPEESQIAGNQSSSVNELAQTGSSTTSKFALGGGLVVGAVGLLTLLLARRTTQRRMSTR